MERLLQAYHWDFVYTEFKQISLEDSKNSNTVSSGNASKWTPKQIKWKLLLNFYKSHALGMLWLTREPPFSHSNGDLQITKYLWKTSLLPFKDNTAPWPQTMKIIRGRAAHPSENWQWKKKNRINNQSLITISMHLPWHDSSGAFIKDYNMPYCGKYFNHIDKYISTTTLTTFSSVHLIRTPC